MIFVAPVADLADSARHVVALRSWRNPSQHDSVLVYRRDPHPGALNAQPEFYSIANECPHLGLPLEDDGVDPRTGPVIICPFHNLDFGLDTGASSSGMRACTFALEVRNGGELWMEPPGDLGDDYRVIGIRSVSERASSSPSSCRPSQVVSLILLLPRTIVAYCRHVLVAPTPAAKVALVRRLVSLFRSGTLSRLADPLTDPPHPFEPYRAPTVKTVASGQTARLGRGGSVESRVRLLHALANIELFAIDLAVDHIGRFFDWRVASLDGREGKRIGWGFVGDFLKVAEDEAKHFTILSERLEQLGCTYGSLSVHNGLWESATQTSHSLLSRLAIVALVHEARGLDTNPTQIRRCRAAGDEETARVLEIVHADEICHVAFGHRHFTALCASQLPVPLDPVTQFRAEVRAHFFGAVRGPFNEADRARAGLGGEWYEGLSGRGSAAARKGEEKEAAARGGGKEA
ncbi:uncharacterized protein RHOBADRAFT_13884 [Rhodotorula graminis WP1]|uniref:Rieske domain-containing protein n=1 Tax=Rhodotorula graminis (strain WP1) TaxID=578459 RepID=A0A194S5R1_RHOGW|nr:uncharacterized protein RHOBADRAFT_13884 [Rhodotorula graminis WP1]KPV75879.1 hypothetical protein RHOBADRAFT_13884 [Rhodotorula graminis WP1]